MKATEVVKRACGKTQLFWNKNGSTILTGMAAAGVVGTVVLTVKATTKASKILERAKEEKGEDLTKLEVVKAVGPVYIPTAVTGAATIACMFGANVLNKRKQASLVSAYALLDQTFKEYKTKVVELYGEEAAERIKEGLAKDRYTNEETDIPDADDEKPLYYDEYSGRYFNATKHEVLGAVYGLNRDLFTKDYAYLNEWYEQLGLEPLESGWDQGWSVGGNRDRYWQDWIDVDTTKVVLDDGLECHILSFRAEPYLNFADYC